METTETSITENNEIHVNENSKNNDPQQISTDTRQGKDVTMTKIPEDVEESTGEVSTTEPATNVLSQRNFEDKHEKVEQKPEAVSAQPQREKSISEILDERTHANVVRQARQAGVSTEGTTSEILDRITRKNLERLK